MQTIINFFSNSKVKGVIAVICCVIMYYTPDEVDRIIEAFMAFYGISHLLPRKEAPNE